MLRAVSQGFSVSKPYGDNQPYDFVVQQGGPVQRVQVKSTFVRVAPGRGNGFQVMIAWKSARGVGHYSRREIDFLAAFIGPLDMWYIIPVDKLARTVAVCFYPLGSTRPTAGRYEKYREAWGLLKG
jgi:PD-(D/E)XK endonuclease